MQTCWPVGQWRYCRLAVTNSQPVYLPYQPERLVANRAQEELWWSGQDSWSSNLHGGQPLSVGQIDNKQFDRLSVNHPADCVTNERYASRLLTAGQMLIPIRNSVPVVAGCEEKRHLAS